MIRFTAMLALLLPALSASAGTPMAQGHDKFLGSAYSAPQAEGFERWFNKVTPENAGKWGRVEAQRDQMDDKQLGRVEAIICSMTTAERRDHTIINGSRRKRIARGSGTTVEEVNRVLKQFVEMRKMLKVVAGVGGGRKGRQRLMGMLRGMR